MISRASVCRSVMGLVASVMTCGALCAQIQNKPQDWTAWVGNRLAVVEQASSKILRLESVEGSSFPEVSLKAPEGTLVLEFKDQAAWATVKGSEGMPDRTLLYRSLNLKTWEVNCTYLGESGRANGIYHLDGKRYFLVSGPAFFTLAGKSSPYAIAHINDKGYLTLANLIELDLKLPLVQAAQGPADGGKSKGEFNPKYSALLGMLFGNQLIRFPGGLALVAKRPGYIWLFDERMGSLRRLVKVVPRVTEDRLGPPQQLEWAILGCQPRQNGHLLIASRDESAVLDAVASYPTRKNLKYLEDEAQQKANLEQEKASLLRWPQIRWWDLDPEDGTLTEEPPPQGAPDRIWELQILHSFKFRYRPDGSVLVN